MRKHRIFASAARRGRTGCFGLIVLFNLSGCDSAGEVPPAVGTLERDRVELAADSSEPVIAIDVQEGDRVTAGARLLAQDSERISARLRAAQAQAGQAQAALDEALAGPRPEAREAAAARLAAATSIMATAGKQLQRERALLADGLTDRNRVDALAGDYDAAAARVEEAAAGLAELQSGTRAEQVEQRRQALEAARAVVSELEVNLSRSRLRAPVDGLVEAVNVDPGERPGLGATLVVLRRDMTPYARVYLPEPLRNRLTPGTSVRVHIDGYEEPFTGRVRFVATEAVFTPYFALTQRDRSRLSYLAEIDVVDPRAADLPSGIPVRVEDPRAGG